MYFFVPRSSLSSFEAEQNMKNSADRGGCYPQIQQLIKQREIPQLTKNGQVRDLCV